MADAYGTLANGGSHIAPTILSKVVFPDGSSLNLGDPPHKQVFSSGETYAATKVLETVIQSGTGTAADYGCPAAGKTGTAENMDNAWFVGYTPQLSTAVWVGYPQSNNIPMPDGFGGALAAPIWHDYMAQARRTASAATSRSRARTGTGPRTSARTRRPARRAPRTAAPGRARRSGSGSGSGSGSQSNQPVQQPDLYAHPPQPATPTTTTGGAAAPRPAGGGRGERPRWRRAWWRGTKSRLT